MSESPQKKPSVQTIHIDSGQEGQRIDNFLLGFLKGVPRSYIYRIVRTGEVRVNKGRVKASTRLQVGDSVRIPPVRVAEKPLQRKPDTRLLQRLETAVLYEDTRFLVLNKPSGLAVHGGSGIHYGVIEALRILRPEQRQLELVHRLDRDTSGCLLIAKRRSALRTLHDLLRNNGVDKRYLALLEGDWPQDRVEVDAPLQKNTLKSGERIVRVDPAGKPALTRFRLRQRFSDSMLVAVRLMTGRTHQIRVHAAHLGTPILGDQKYGDEAANRKMRSIGLRRLFLHAESVGFRWPGEDRDLIVRAPLDPELELLMKRLEAGEGATT